MSEKDGRTGYDRIIEGGVQVLVVATPLAFGTVHDWSSSVMEIIVFIVFGAWSVKSGLRFGAGMSWPLLALLTAGLTLPLLQIVPLPAGIVRLVSPSLVDLYTQVGAPGQEGWMPLSMNTRATIEEWFRITAYVLIFIVVASHYTTTGQVKKLCRTIVAVGAFLTVFAALQFATWNGKLYWVFPVREELAAAGHRFWGPYINRNHFAGYLAMVVPIAYALFLHRIAVKQQASSRQSQGFTQQLLILTSSVSLTVMGLSSIAMIAAIFGSFSRGGIVAFTAGTACFSLMVLSRRSTRSVAGAFAPIAAILLVSIMALLWPRVEHRFEAITDVERIKRFDIWKDAGGILYDFPILGTGLGTFRFAYPRYQTENTALQFDHAENDYLELATELGSAGVLLALGTAAAYLGAVYPAWRQRKNRFVLLLTAGGIASCCALAVHGAVDFNFRIPANALLFSIIAGITIATARNVRSAKRRDHAV